MIGYELHFQSFPRIHQRGIKKATESTDAIMENLDFLFVIAEFSRRLLKADCMVLLKEIDDNKII